MRHLTIYRHDMTPAAWATEGLLSGLGRLPDAVEPRTRQAINGDWSFTMRYPIKGDGYDLLEKGRLICAEGQLYRVYKIKKTDQSKGREVQVDARHIFYDLRKKEIPNLETSETDLDGITQAQALGLVLAGTPFTVGAVDNTETLEYLDLLQKNALWALQEQVIKLWGGEMVPDNWTINIKGQAGQDRRFPIRRGMNIKGIDYTEDIDEIITRLHVSGYQGATFEEINGGLDYIDSPNIDAYRFLGAGAGLEGRAEFADDDEPAVLMEKGLAHLSTVDVPRISYDVDLLDLKNSQQYALYRPLTTFGLGDTAVIHHDFFNVDITARALDRERDPVLEENVSVVLGNYKKDLYSMLAGAANAAEAVGKVLAPGGSLRGDKLRGTIDLLQTQLRASGSYADAQVLGNRGLLLENLDEDSANYGAMYGGPGLLALANTKNTDGSWDWQTFAHPGGLVGYLIEAHTVGATQINADSLFADVAFVAKMVTGLVQSNLGEELVLTSNAGIKAISDGVNALNNWKTSAEQQITPTAITNTVRNSAPYQGDLAKRPQYFVQSTQPTSGMVAGDFWINNTPTTGKNAIKRYSGSAWTPVDNTDIALALQTANKIQWLVASGTDAASMTLTSKLYELVAANIDLSASSRIRLLVDGVVDPIDEKIDAVIEAVPGQITAAVSGPQSDANYAKALSDAVAKMSTGNWVYQDPVFKEGINDVSVYNNAGNGAVQISRIAKPADCPAVSTHCLQISHTGLAAPELGGFVQPLWSRPNAVFVVKYLAKLPVGYTLVKASNAMGDNWTDNFIGQAAGTGKWEEYIRVIRCGATGTFSLGGHVYVTGPTPSVAAPLVWQLGAIYAYDASDTNSLPARITAAEFKLRPEEILLAIASQSHIVLTPQAVEILGGIIRFMSDQMDFILLKNGLEALQINTDGISSSLPISSPSILSPSVLGVYRGAQSIPWAGSINASIANVAKYLPYESFLIVPAGTYQENVVFDGFCGNRITLYFVGSTTIEGGVIVQNCTSRVYLINNGPADAVVTILHGASSSMDAPVYQVGCNLTLNRIRVTGKNRPVAGAGSSVGVHAMDGAVVSLDNCTIERTNGYGVLGERNCLVDMYQCRGGQAGGDYSTLQNLGSGALVTRGSILNLYETCPLGAVQAYGNWQAPAPVGTPTPTASAGAAPVITTRTLTYNAAFGGTVYPGSTGGWEWMSSDTFSSAWQTNNTTYGDRMPVWGLFGASGIAATIGSGTVLSARLKIQRGTAWGDSGPVALHLKYHNYADRAAVVAGTAKPTMTDIADVSFVRGETKTIDLPPGVLTALKSGACKGFGGSNLTPALMMVGDVCTLEITVQGGP